MKSLAALLGGALIALAAAGCSNGQSGLAVYGKTSSYCGPGAVPNNPSDFPWIGCFSISRGHSVTGTIGGRHVVLAVDDQGRPSYTVDGVAVEDAPAGSPKPDATNLPYVMASSGGYAFCDDTGKACAATTTAWSYNDDPELFWISECGPAPVYTQCAITKENYDSILQHIDPKTGAYHL